MMVRETAPPFLDGVSRDRPRRGWRPRVFRGRSRFSVIAGYVSREFFFGFFVCFLFFFAVFFVNQILLMAEDILSRKAQLRDVILLLFYALPSVIAMSFPFASLVGALMAAGRLSSDNEMLAVMAAGIPPRRAFTPFLVLGLAFSLVSFAMNDYFLPRGSIEFSKLYRRLVASTPALELRPWSSKRYKDVTVVTGDMVGSRIKDLLIFDRSDEDSERVISAGEAGLVVDEKRGDIVLDLSDVWQQTVKKGESDRFEWARASTMKYRISMREQGSDASILGPRDMPSIDLAKIISEKASTLELRREKRDEDLSFARASLSAAYDAELGGVAPWANSAERLAPALASLRSYGTLQPSDRTLQVYRLEYYKKFSIPFGALFFVVLGFPLGLLAKKSGRTMGFGVGILISVIYWALLLGGQTLGTRLSWSPFWSIWAPNAAVLTAGLALWVARVRTR
ncbi:MAG: LptF/LptG family permease [Rectinemataceae bacterium]